MQSRLLLSVAVSLLFSAGAAGQASHPGNGAADAHVVELGGSDIVVKAWADPAGERYAISRDGGESFPIERAAEHEILLRYARFDPAGGVPFVPGHLRTADDGGGEQSYIVQFITQPLEAYRRDIRAAGGAIYKYLAHQAYLIRMDDDTRERVAGLGYVRWIGRYEPAYKVDEQLLAALTADDVELPATRLYVQVFERGLIDKRRVANRVLELGGAVNAVIADGFLLEITVDEQQLVSLLQMPEIVWVDPWSPRETDMGIAREIGGANFVENETGFSGEGVRAEVMDTNLNDAHQDFQNIRPMFHGARSGSTFHGTETYGINFGDGTGSSDARGMVPDAQGIFADFGHLSNRYTHTTELVQSPYFAVYQSNSWGNQRTRTYTNISFQMDDIIFQNDIVICQSQSNAGNQDSRPQAWAKNIVSVGGVRHNNTLAKSDDRWGGGASIGPAADGRIKPDLTHFYDNIRTTDYRGGYTNGFGGTSGATPIIAGHFGVFFQMWSEGIFGNAVDPNDTVFENRSHAMTAKAMMINTADPYDWTNGGSNADLTRVRQGWGMADVGQMYEDRDRLFVVDESTTLENTESASYTLMVSDGTREFRATLVYMDPPGTTSSQQHRINDLTLKVTAPGGSVYYGNNGLMSDIWSTPGGNPNTIDTVENVRVQNPESGQWTVEVIASEINEDGHPATQEVDAAFALVVAGVTPRGTVAELTALQVVRGEHIGGGLGRLRDSDNRWLRVNSIFTSEITETNVVEISVDGHVDGSPSRLNLLFEGHVTNPECTTVIRMHNWRTGELDEVTRFGIGQSDSVTSVEGIDATDYVRGDGTIRVNVLQIIVATFLNSGFESRTDQIEISFSD